MNLANKSKDLSKHNDYHFLSVKLPQDPSLIRGFTEAGFLTAEITTVLKGPITKESNSEYSPPPKLSGIIVKSGEEVELSSLLNHVGDLFYDGHHLHSPYLPEDFARKLWSQLTQDGLSKGDIAVFAKEELHGNAVGFAMAELTGTDATLTILHVNADRRNQGLGALILKNLFFELYEKGGRTIVAETASWNLPALSLYINFGMRPKAPLIALHAKI
jgi:GNAT superfamily N-acetyltransferase